VPNFSAVDNDNSTELINDKEQREQQNKEVPKFNEMSSNLLVPAAILNNIDTDTPTFN
jgi:hypothetical protein